MDTQELADGTVGAYNAQVDEPYFGRKVSFPTRLDEDHRGCCIGDARPKLGVGNVATVNAVIHHLPQKVASLLIQFQTRSEYPAGSRCDLARS